MLPRAEIFLRPGRYSSFDSGVTLLTPCRSRPPWPSRVTTFSRVVASLGRPTPRPGEATLPPSAWPPCLFAARKRPGRGLRPLSERRVWGRSLTLLSPSPSPPGRLVPLPPFPGSRPGRLSRPLGLRLQRLPPPPPPAPPPLAGVLLGCFCPRRSPSTRVTSRCRVLWRRLFF